MLEIRVLGTLEVIRDGTAAPLPPSRKARALLAYLALTRCAHRREQLCEMFWDVPDDPRGALRWSLSKIRPVVNEPEVSRLIADRNTVELRTETADIDFFATQSRVADKTVATSDLARAASSFRGPLLADLDLAEGESGFRTWLLALREDARRLHTDILRLLIDRLAGAPEQALPYVRELVRVDPFEEAAWAKLIETLVRAGRTSEIKQQYEAGLDCLREVGGGAGALLRAWRAAQAAPPKPLERGTPPAGAELLRASIVVLPFANLSDDPEQQYFADGITGNLITDLARIPDMLVISRNTAFTYRNKPIDTKQIGRELGVRYVLEGEVQRAASQVRVTAQLIDAESDVHLWAERFAGDANDLFALQDEITSRIAAALDLELVAAEASRPTDRPDIRDYIFRGRAVRLRPPSRENRTEAIELFQQAFALDPHSPTAQAWLAIALTARVLDYMADAPAADIARAELHADYALANAPRIALTHFAKAQVLRAQRRFAEAIAEYEAVVALNRNWSHAYSHLGWCRFVTGSLDDLIPAQQQAIRLSPRDPQIGLFYSRIGSAHLLQSNLEEAVIWYERARNATPAHPEFRTFLASAYALKGDPEAASVELAQARRLAGDDRCATIARFKAISFWGVPEVSALAEATYFSGLRHAGVPDE